MNTRIFKIAALTVMLAALPLSSAMAQSQIQTKRGPYVTNGFWDNWFISAGAGVQGYFGESFDKGDTFITPAFDFSIGKWITPVWGARVQLAGLSAKSATMNANNPFVVSRYDNNYYNIKMKYMHYHADALFNLSAAIGGYKPTRVYEIIPFIGFGGISTYSGPTSNEMAFDGGILNKFRISEHFDINIELRGVLFGQEFDKQAGGSRGEGIGSITAGLTYRFGKKTFKRASELEMMDISPLNNRINQLEDALAANKAKQAALESALAEANRRPTEVIVEQQVAPAATAVFFTIGRTDINAEGKIVLDQMAETIKASDCKYTITGFADKQTGSAQRNMQLSQQRAQNVHDYLVSKGVSADRLDVIAKGSTENPFSQAYLNRVVIVQM